MSQPHSHVAVAIQSLLRTGARKATVYESPTHVTKVTLRKKSLRGERTTEFVVTIGRPNFLERQFIKSCKRAREPFPVRKIQLKYFPKKKK